MKITISFGRALPLTCWLVAASTAPAAISTFDFGAEGWSIVSFTDVSLGNFGVVGSYSVDFNSTGGNPGGYISKNDPDGGDFTFSAPAAFLGDLSAAFGTNLSYSIIYTGPNDYAAADVQLTSGSGNRLLYIPAPSFLPSSIWSNRSVPLTSTAEWHFGTPSGPTPTASQFQSVLADLNGLFIRGEYSFGADATGIDNVQLVPEPGTIALLFSGLFASVRRTRNRAVRG